MIDPELYRHLIDLISYMTTSARGLIDEPQLYGPFRLVEGVSRICGFLEKQDGVDQEFLSRLRETIDQGKFSVMTDVEAFTGMLDEAVLMVARQLKKTEPSAGSSAAES
jgi:hypothetical protein